MKTLFVDRKDSEIALERGRLTIKFEGQRRLFSIPTRILDMLVISAAVQFSSSLLTRLTQDGVTMVFINPRQTTSCTMTHGMMHNDASRRLLQYRAVTDADVRMHYALRVVTARLEGQRQLLLRAMESRVDKRHPLQKGIATIDAVMASMDQVRCVNTLRGKEGAGAAAYFEAYQHLFAPSLAFNGRNRRPPKDPVNVTLSLSYTLLHAEAVRTLIATGFDPMLGLYHEPSYGRESLACDLVELFRAIVEGWVWRLFAEETLRQSHFTFNEEHDKPCVLGKAGREIYYHHYSRLGLRCRRLMRRVARHWLAELQLIEQSESMAGPENIR